MYRGNYGEAVNKLGVLGEKKPLGNGRINIGMGGGKRDCLRGGIRLRVYFEERDGLAYTW